MIRSSLKNFGKNIILLFLPMGIFYFFLLIALFVLFSATLQNFSETLARLSELLKTSLDGSTASVEDFLSYSFSQINWNQNFFETLRQIFGSDWIPTTLRGFFQTLSASSAGFEEQFSVIVNDCLETLKADLGVTISLISFGIVFANFATRVLLRHRIARRNVKKFLIARTLVPLAQSLAMLLAAFLALFIRYFSLLVLIALLVLTGVLSMTSSWLIHRAGKLKWREAVNSKTVLSYLGSAAVIALINLLVALFLFFINPLFALLLMIPVVIYSINIVDTNTDAFVASLAAKKQEELSASQTAENAPNREEKSKFPEEILECYGTKKAKNEK